MKFGTGNTSRMLTPMIWGLALVASQGVFAAGIVLDPPAVPPQKPYSPADGQVVAVNPPPFIWVPAGGGHKYLVQISRTESFDPADTRTFKPIATSVFVPSEPLPHGRWFWRYGVITDEGEKLGRPRPFTVPDDAHVFPFPAFDRVVADVPHQHPRLFFPGERLERIRDAARGELKSDVDRLVQRCRKVVGEEIVAEPIRPKTGPEKVMVMRTTRPPMDDMEGCALAWLLTRDEDLGAEAKRRVMHFFSWDPQGNTGLWSYDEPAMWVMMRGIRAYDWTHDLYTDGERARIEPVMKERTRQFYVHLKERRKFESNPYESHAGRMPGFLGEAALCFAHEWPEAKGWLEYATLLYYTSYPAWGGDAGGWQEGPAYWRAYMSFALHYVAALKHATGVDLMGKPFFRNTPYFILYTAPPYNEHGYFGDGASGRPTHAGRVMYAFSSLLEDSYLRWFADQSRVSVGEDLLTLATYAPELQAQAPTDLPDARVFEDVGMAALHTDLGNPDNDITFLLRSSPFGSMSHGHADMNAFVVDAFGRGLAIKTGYYPWYSSPHHHEWTRDTKAANSILVNGQGQIKRQWNATGRIVRTRFGEQYDYVEAEAGDAYGDRVKSFRRHVFHIKPGIYVIYDAIEATEPNTYQWLLHAHDKIEVDGQKMTIRRAPGVLTAEMLLPDDVTITQTDKYDPEPEVLEHKSSNYVNTWHLTASTQAPSMTGQFLTVIEVRKEGEPSRIRRMMPEASPPSSPEQLRLVVETIDGMTHRFSPVQYAE